MDRSRIFEVEFATYNKHKESLLATDEGKYVLIKGDKIYGTFADEMDAINAGYREIGSPPFLVHPIEKIEEPIAILGLQVETECQT